MEPFFMKKLLIFFAKSKYADVFGVALVISIAIASGYLNTKLSDHVNWGPWTSLVPLGIISVINVGISMMSTRLNIEIIRHYMKTMIHIHIVIVLVQVIALVQVIHGLVEALTVAVPLVVGNGT